MKLHYAISIRLTAHVGKIYSIEIIFSTIHNPDHLDIKILPSTHLIWMN